MFPGNLSFHFVSTSLFTSPTETREINCPKSRIIAKPLERTIKHTIFGQSHIVKYFLQFASRVLQVLPGIKVTGIIFKMGEI